MYYITVLLRPTFKRKRALYMSVGLIFISFSVMLSCPVSFLASVDAAIGNRDGPISGYHHSRQVFHLSPTRLFVLQGLYLKHGDFFICSVGFLFARALAGLQCCVIRDSFVRIPT